MRLKKPLLFLVLLLAITLPPIMAQQSEPDIELVIIELRSKHGGKPISANAIPPTDDSMTNPHYQLLGFHWYSSVNYYINPKNPYGFEAKAVVSTITTSADTWDAKTSFAVFSYKGTTTRAAGKRDGYNVVAWGSYKAGVIGVTYLWRSILTGKVVETDTRLNTYYSWSLSGEGSKMDVQNIMTHEFGHWCGLADLYNDVDYWLTMYGYSNFGLTYARTLGLGDIDGLKAVYGS